MNLPIKIKKLSPDAVIPEYKHEGDAGFDLSADRDSIIYPGQTTLIHTGLSVSVPEGYELQIRPRSGLSLKTPLRVILGTVDSGYHGELCIIAELKAQQLFKYGEMFGIEDVHVMKIHKGERIAQAVIAPVVHATFEQVDELGDSERGKNGFGSTGA